jgi:hypothetical protein
MFCVRASSPLSGRRNLGIFLKDPVALIDYAVDWAEGYLVDQTIIASSWSVLPAEPGGITVASDIITATRTRATLAGGIPGHVYRITNRVTLSDTRSDERSLTIRVEQR